MWQKKYCFRITRKADLLPFNDRIPTPTCSRVVYKFKWACYDGKTSRHLDTRCREHLGIGKTGNPVKVGSSAIFEHKFILDTMLLLMTFPF